MIKKSTASKLNGDSVALHTIIIILFFLLSIVFTFPLILHMNTHIPALTVYDPPLYVWNSWNFKKAIFEEGYNPLTAPYLLYPFEPSVAFHDYTIARNILVVALSPLFNTVTSFNIVTLLMFTFSGYGAYLLTRRFVNNRFAAFLSGFIFSFCPFKTGRLLGHFNFIDSAFIPFYILFLYKTFTEKKKMNGVFAGIFLALIGYCSYYYLVFSIIVTLIIAIYYLFPDTKSFIRKSDLTKRTKTVPGSINRIVGIPLLFVIFYLFFIGYIRYPPVRVSDLNRSFIILALLFLLNFTFRYKISAKQFARALKQKIYAFWSQGAVLNWIITFALFIALFSPILITIFTLQSDYMGADVFPYKVPDYPSFEDLFKISGLSSIKRLLTGTVALNLERLIYIGMPALILTVYSIIFIRKKAHIKLWYITGGTFAVFALGHTLQSQGRALLWLPYNIIQLIPLLRGAIHPARYIIITMLAVGIICAFAAEDIHLRIKKRFKGVDKARLISYAAAGFLLIIITAEYITFPIFISDITPPAFYYRLAEDKEDYAILEIPFLIVGKARWIGGWVERWGLFQYYQSVHNKRLLSGYLSYIPDAVVPYYTKNQFMQDIVFLQKKDNPDPVKSTLLKRNRTFQAKKFLDLFNVRYIILHRQDLSSGTFDYVDEYLKRSLPEITIAEDNKDLRVYRLTPTKRGVFLGKDLLSPKQQMTLISGWSEYCTVNGNGGRYAVAKKARLLFPAESKRTYELWFSAALPEVYKEKEQEIEVRLNHKTVAVFKLARTTKPATKRISVFKVILPSEAVAPGSNILDFRFDTIINGKAAWFREIKISEPLKR